VLQTSPWAELKRGYGWSSERVGLWDADRLVGGAQILFRRLPAGLGTLAYVPKGPLVDWSDREACAQLIEAMDEAARANGAVALSVEPNLQETAAHRESLRALGFRPAPFGAVQPRRTLVVDIQLDEDAILMAMKSKTRYNIRLAGRKGVVVREAETEDVSREDVPTFNDLLAATADRADFGIHPPAYYRKAYELFAPREWAQILLAEVDGQAVVCSILLPEIHLYIRKNRYFFRNLFLKTQSEALGYDVFYLSRDAELLDDLLCNQ